MFDRQRAGHLAGRVGTHAVGDHEQPPTPSILVAAPRHQHRLRVLVVGPAAADVGEFAVVEGGAGCHASNPEAAKPS